MEKKETKKIRFDKENISPPKESVIVVFKSISKDTSSLMTDDTDIIECSIVNENKNNFLKTPRTNPKRHSLTKSNAIKIPNGGKTVDNSKTLNKSLRSAVKSNYGLFDDASIAENIKTESILETPHSKTNTERSNSATGKILSSLKITPEGTYLSKSKLRNIELWLYNNDVGTIQTPPFADLSVTPVTSTKKCHKTSEKSVVDDYSVDSEVEGVLKAVYGDQWTFSNVHSKCKTEPRRRLNKVFSPLTQVKKRVKKKDLNIAARRNILHVARTNETKVNKDYDRGNFELERSGVSGIEIINLDSSNSGEEEIPTGKNFTDLKKMRKPFLGLGSARPERDFRTKVKSNDEPYNDRVSCKKPVLKNFKNSKLTLQKDSTKTPKKKTFLASLSVSTPTSRCHPDAQYYKINFKSKKEELVKTLYQLYNGEVFDGKLAEDLNFSWNVKLRGTAGYCYNKRITKSTGEIIRLSRIEFSTKIVDRADRLRDTMIHELCHAASWVIDGVLDGHGPVWNNWASKAMHRFPELPVIKRCHNYDVLSKYVYRCTGCGYSIKRHSKSINVERKRCGHCYGVLELLINKKKKGKGEIPEFNTTRTLRAPNKFALFVKENYHSVRSVKNNAKHAEIMKILSQQYALVKSGKKLIPND